MKKVWAVGDCIVSSLGITTDENYSRVRMGESGIKEFLIPEISTDRIFTSRIQEVSRVEDLSFFEQICCMAIERLLVNTKLDKNRTVFILSTTKGNIQLLDEGKAQQASLHLHASAKSLATRFGFRNYLVVSNACISGVLALITAKRLIQSGLYSHAVVVGGDTISKFVISGFRSLLALSDKPCQPFDANRSGINLGEAAAAMLVTATPDQLERDFIVELSGEATSNDANHISGPSRTGHELASAIGRALHKASLQPTDIDFISAHGTATTYNDEMEANAFHLAGLENVPLNSLKGYYGHTLGAAGLVESIISIRSLLNNEVIGTKGFTSIGVSRPVWVAAKTRSLPMTRILKTASGFGGCNAAIVFEKVNE